MARFEACSTRAQHPPEAGDEARLALERLDDFDAAQRFLEVSVHLAHGPPVGALRVANAHLEEARDDDERRQHDRGRRSDSIGLRMTIAAAIVTRRTRFATSAATPLVNTVSSVSMSAVQRLMASPSGVRSK